MTELQKIVDALRAMVLFYDNVDKFSMDQKYDTRSLQNFMIIFTFIQFLYRKSLCNVIFPTSLKEYEANILKIIARGEIFMDNHMKVDLANNVKEIEIILLNLIPPESEEYKKLLRDIPDVKKFMPEIG